MTNSFFQKVLPIFEKHTPTIFRLVNRYWLLVKYVISGGTAALVDLTILVVLTEVFKIWYLSSAVIAFLFAFFVSFFLQKFWTFNDQRTDKLARQMGVYLILAIGNLILNTALMYVFVDIFGVHYFLSQIIVGLIVASMSFFISKIYIFKYKDEIARPNPKG